MTSERSICISWSMLPFCYETLAEAIHTAIQPEFRVPTDFFILYACNHSKKICSFLFFSGWPFDQKLGSSLIYFFLCARNHLTKIYDPLSFIFLLSTTIQRKCMIFFHLLFLLSMTIQPKIKIHTDLFLYMYTASQPKVRVLINLLVLYVHDHSTKT